ncbi:prolyl 4-hydroxylase [Diaporthe eres]|uniref:Fe2OG dioxygenase domain-containing protein n=2 Tax=Diaporthe vaccinii TaxID=105482 RepID=A0ABR4DTH5_9PEZI|nr:prolyl 4-hydroxylase [Diaporthe eres]
MSKSKQKRKQQSQQQQLGAVKKVKTGHSAATTNPVLPTVGAAFEPKFLSTVVPEEDLEITVETLRALVENPGLIKSKACKDLRTAVFEFRKACTTGFNAAADANLTSRISGALADGGHTEARILLAEMRIRQQAPKLGALCRWVRDLDVISGLAEQREGKSRRTEAQAETLKVLDAILRVTGPVDHSPAPPPSDSVDKSSPGDSSEPGPLAVRPAWDLRDTARPRRMVYDSVLDGTLATSMPSGMRAQFRVIQTVPGPERNPPNQHPATVWASRDGAIALAAPSSPEAPATTHHSHPTVPGLHLLRDVLSPDECGRIVGAAEAVGFAPDAPVRPGGDVAAATENSVLAHNFYWVADDEFCRVLWGRVGPFVPERVSGRKVRGLNRRFRVYRYVPGAEYRAHIDGAWPPSGILPDDTYQYDASPADAKQSSLFTFLVYLNDEFSAGETTFFLPSAREGTLNAYPVRPIQGSVAMFPHGETEGSLLHEGTGVRRGERPSAKYVIRTDVEYDVDPGRD